MSNPEKLAVYPVFIYFAITLILGLFTLVSGWDLKDILKRCPWFAIAWWCLCAIVAILFSIGWLMMGKSN